MTQVRLSGDGDNLGVSFSYNTNDLFDNSAAFTLTIVAEGQPVLVNGVQHPKVELTIVGGWELSDFLKAMKIIANHKIR